jgi:hypothetical protein
MEPFSYVKIFCFVVNAAALAAFVYFSVQLHRAKPKGLAWRGLVKLVSLGEMPADFGSSYRRWFVTFVVFYLVTCTTVSVYVWATDHSFFVVLFPLLFYYFFARYLLWEKQDLAD